MTKEIEWLYEELKKLADEDGYILQPDEGILKDLLVGLLENEQRYGYRSCPCRLAAGILVDDMDIICPCDYRDIDLEEYGCCYCTLYVNEDWISGKKSHDPIPERRPMDMMLRKHEQVDMAMKATAEEISVWRCTVCGYLCARDEPPNQCPICRAKKERFEKFSL